MKIFKICYFFFNTSNTSIADGYWDMASAVVVDENKDLALIYFYSEVCDSSVKIRDVSEIGSIREIIWAL